MKLTPRTSKSRRSQTALAVLIALGVATQANAQDVDGLVDASALEGVIDVRQLADGSVELVFENGDVVTLSADQVALDDGQILVSVDTLAGLADGGFFNFLGDNVVPVLVGVGAAAVALGVGLGVSGGSDAEDDGVDPVLPTTPVGTAGADSLTGTNFGETIDGLAGDDTIDGAGGDDTLIGGEGADTLIGGVGTDTLTGGAGDDTLFADADDTLDGGEGTDTVDLSEFASGVVVDLDIATPGGEDSQDGGILSAPIPAGGEVLNALTDIENVIGTAGDDTIFGNNEVNVLDGGAGDDVIHSFAGADTVIGGEGSDTVLFTAGPAVEVNLDENGDAVATVLLDTPVAGDTLVGVENLTGSAAGDDILSGNDSANILNGNGGADTLNGEGGDDTFISDALDTIDGGAGTDTVDFSGAEEGIVIDLDVATPGGEDSQDGGLLTAPPAAGGTVTVEIDDVENVIGTAFDDTIFGNNEVNVLEGGAGDDVFHSFAGADTVDGGEGTDTVLFSATPAGVTVTLDDTGGGVATIGTGEDAVESDTLISIENITGSGVGDDVLTGNAGANVLTGLGGDDVLFGLGGNDTLTGGDGDDILAGGGGVDTIDGGAGIDTNSFEGIGLGVEATLNADGTGTAVYGSVNESFTGIENLIGTANDDVLIATGAAANTISGGDGDDIIAGGGGTDVLDGGAGNDTNSFQGIGLGVTASLADGTAVYGSVNETFTNFENLTGSSNDDNLTGDDGANVLDGAAGADTLIGGGGDDTIISDGLDTIDGGDGVDTVDFSGATAGIIIDLDTATPGPTNSEDGGILDAPPAAGGTVIVEVDNVENVVGTDFDDGLFGNNEVNVLQGGAGNDLIHSFGGADTLDGGEGVDTALFNATPVGVTVALDDEGNATSSVGDTLISIENLTGSASGDDTLTGNASANVLTGLGGDDVLDGGGGADTLNGGDGDDTIVSDGLDTIDGGAGTDTADFSGSEVGVIVDLDIFSSADPGNLDDGFVVQVGVGEFTEITGVENVIGTAFGDGLSGNDAVNVLSGGAGDDTLTAQGGGDTLDGGEGVDTAVFTDAGITAELSDDGNGTSSAGDILISIENLSGTSTNSDVLIGNSADNVLNGFGGGDTLTGGGGSDTFLVGFGFGSNTITDFTVAEDVIDLSGLGLTAAEALGLATDDGSGNVVLDLTDAISAEFGLSVPGSLTLTGVAAADLTEDSFLGVAEAATASVAVIDLSDLTETDINDQLAAGLPIDVSSADSAAAASSVDLDAADLGLFGDEFGVDAAVGLLPAFDSGDSL